MKKSILSASLLLISVVGFAQIQKPSKWTFSSSNPKAKVGETVELIFSAKIDEGWYMYGSELKVEGPNPTELELIAGIGKTTAEKLLKYFKSVKKIREASEEVLMEVVNTKQAKAIIKYFKEK